ncbi:MAG: alanine dehydrogenase [Gemmatimonadetes bacterium]|uniref:alanine dehydrogenase n=1 Tax=Candidatus Kutchimonas denitrificans TaxID=3056748 RepID=A0AAE4Z977_9BACT|nr:alanine dehydrogenase [Gemmatimonadota bacterium]NIR73811.1 alanine dehydrogenase [Candidatus Kutchimonas denitrificans]NIS00084.1 alanine dehydrogenase [Gemmatimonadota bacterium]NIT65673.1 alanine dehydrogenase [Gemmatimonadota bacterium]NIU53121.1 alanine dehydrogenase [Gemmatimonadota bacterium]
MYIGVPRETHRLENRVGLSPYAVSRLTHYGHTVLVETDAGAAAKFSDAEYERAGAQVVFNTEEAYKRADIVCRVGLLSSGELDLLKPGSTICAFHHLAVCPREDVERLMELETTIIGYEIIQDSYGDHPILAPMSEMAGQMAMHLASYYLQNTVGGRGTLLGNVAGVAPPTVLILGAGSVGYSAARQAVASGVHVIVVDEDLRKLRALSREFSGQVVTAVAGMAQLERFTSIADVLIGAILIPGAHAPLLVTEEMVRAMKPGSVIIDVSIDQGGCVETSRPTTLDDPTFVTHGVVHYCVPNMTANLARTASRALANAALPTLKEMTRKGVTGALREDSGLRKGVYLFNGRMVNEKVGGMFDIPVAELDELLDMER